MASVTQRIPNYLGGISQQSEELMLPGQVIDAENAFVDPTLGLVKRTGLQYISDLRSGAGPITPTNTLRAGKWFPIFLGPGKNFFACVTTSSIRVFGEDGVERTVNTPDGVGYLSSINGPDDVAYLTVNEYTIIANKNTTVTAEANSSFNTNRLGTVLLRSLGYGAIYSVTLELPAGSASYTVISYTSFNAEPAITTPAQTQRNVTARQILTGITAALPAGYASYQVGNTLDIYRTTGNLSFTLSSNGGLGSNELYAYTDTVPDISQLAPKAAHNRTVKIENSEEYAASYWLKFTAFNGQGGDGYWTEVRDPASSPGLTTSTAPHILTYDPALDQFTFEEAPWEGRLAGSNTDDTNPNPSFVGKEIRGIFFTNNRLGFLTDETVVMSQVNDFFNFFKSSAITTVDTDPVDKSVSSITPVRLTAAVPQPQGVILIGDNQQFLMSGVDDVFTPANTTIKSVSNFQTEPNVQPTDMGVTIGFLAPAGNYYRFFEMLSRGQSEQPEVLDLTRIVPEWLPASINTISSSPQAGVVVLGSTSPVSGTAGSVYVYVLRYWQEGQTRNQAWTRWTLPEPVMLMHLDQETLYVILDGARGANPSCYPLCKLNLNQQSGSGGNVNYVFTPTGLSPVGRVIRSQPRLDYFVEIPVADMTWNGTTGITNLYLPSNYTVAVPPVLSGWAVGLSNAVITTNPNGTETDTGLLFFNTSLFIETVGPFTGRYYTQVQGENLTTVNAKVAYGYLYNCAVELPKTYFRTGETAASDYTATLTVHRMRLVTGVTGPFQFDVRSRGRATAQLVQSIPVADYYPANTNPIVDGETFSFPIHQKNDNFSIRLQSPTSFPFTLLSTSWEGQYAPRFYRRT